MGKIQTRKIIKRITKLVLLIGIGLFLFSFFQKDKLPVVDEILSESYKEPIQTKVDMEPFEVKKEGITYLITPLHNYELNGMIVSYHHSSDWLDYYHDKWKDLLNLKDVCVIWGDNIRSEVYQKMNFKNGSYTCYVSFQDDATSKDWLEFKNFNLSNNHLLSDNEEISKKIMSAEKGDQIYLKGYLSRYSIPDGSFERGTSTIRTDYLCETIFVTDFQIIKKANLFWRDIYTKSKYLIIFCIVLFTIIFFKEIREDI